MQPKEDPKDKEARLRERRLSELELQQTTQQSAAGLTSDLRAVYGLSSLIGMPGGNIPSAKPTIGRTKNPSIFDLGPEKASLK